MDKLTVVNNNGQFAIDSREVAEMIEVRHSDLLEKINNYAQYLLNGQFRLVDFFIKSDYEDSTGRTLPCYLLTRKGCDMVANKMTGEKGVLFTATYVTKFEEMEKQQKQPLQIDSKFLFQIAAQLEEKEKQITGLTVENKLLSSQTLSWTSRKVLNAIVNAYGSSIHIQDVNGFQEAWRDFKKELLYKYGINLNSRITNYMNNSGKKTAPKTLDMIHDEELQSCISTAVALCKTHGVDIGEIIQKYNKSA